MKFVVVSDLHLDASFCGDGLRPVGRKLRYFMQQMLLNIAELVKTTGADALLCGGDLYEHDRCSPETAALLRYTFADIDPVPVYIAPGNRDWYGPESLYQQEWSPNVHIFRSSQLSPVAITDGLTLWGAAHCAPAGTPNFLSGFHTDRDGVHIGLFHGSELSELAAQGENKHPHAPFEVADVVEAGLHHVFLGHYHQPCAAALYTYPGNPHPLGFGECGYRGAVLAVISEQGTVQREWRSVADTPFHDLEINITGCFTDDDIRERVRESVVNLRGFARMALHGEVPAELEFNRRDLFEAGRSMEELLLRIGRLQPKDLERIAKEPTVRGQFVRDVLQEDMDLEERNRILFTGLRALAGRHDLGAFS
jgi:DNA repair exonuclease SbcCD nuclease subunit